MLERLTDYVWGATDAELEAEIARSPRLSGQVAQLRRLFQAGCLPRFAPPKEVRQRAIDIMPALRRARLVGSSLALGGVRRAWDEGDSLQMILSEGEFTLRLMVSREGDRYSVLGRAQPGWEIRHQGVGLVADNQGMFSFEAASLDETAMEARMGSEIVAIPPLSEVLGDEPNRSS